jgi:hypothetical protein
MSNRPFGRGFLDAPQTDPGGGSAERVGRVNIVPVAA